jgi:hypothetical protein
MAKLRPACLLVLLLLGATARAQQTSETKKEIWPQVEVYLPLHERFRLVVEAGTEKAGETRDSLEGHVAAYLDCFFRKRITLRAGYRRGFSLDDNPFSEHRAMFDQTFHKPLSHGFVLTDRNRQELRWLKDDFSVRFRNRGKIEKTFAIGKKSLVPYSSGEIFYDSRFSTFNRVRFTVGAELVFAKREYWLMNLRRQRVLDFYYLWQADSRSQPERLHVVGVTFEIHF